MPKPFKTIDEQIILLKNRGLTFKNEEKSKITLLCNNYYNVINYYSKFFMIKGADNYLSNVTFEEIISVYYFDREIKSVFFQASIDVEKCLKSLIAYYFSKAHPQDYSYLNINNFNCSKITKTVNLISSISKTITKMENEKRDNAIKHYIKNHQNVPLWVVINYLSFGQVVQFYEFMKDSDKNTIAKQFSSFANESLGISTIKISPKELNSYLRNIHEVRNVVAHSNKFIGFKCRTHIPYLQELHSIHGITPASDKQDIYNVFVIMRVFLSRGNFITLSNSLRKRMQHLDKKLHSINANEIFSILGFPYDWHKNEAIRANIKESDHEAKDESKEKEIDFNPTVPPTCTNQ